MVSSRFYNYFWNLRADNMKPQKGSKIYLQMALRMELGTGPRTEISGAMSYLNSRICRICGFIKVLQLLVKLEG